MESAGVPWLYSLAAAGVLDSFLPLAKYEAWKDVIVDFDPRDMFRG